MKTYFMLAQTEDSFYISGPLSKDQVSDRLEEQYYGDIPVLPTLPPATDYGLSEIGIIIIEGSVVVPKAKQVVTKFEF